MNVVCEQTIRPYVHYLTHGDMKLSPANRNFIPSTITNLLQTGGSADDSQSPEVWKIRVTTNYKMKERR